MPVAPMTFMLNHVTLIYFIVCLCVCVQVYNCFTDMIEDASGTNDLHA